MFKIHIYIVQLKIVQFSPAPLTTHFFNIDRLIQFLTTFLVFYHYRDILAAHHHASTLGSSPCGYTR